MNNKRKFSETFLYTIIIAYIINFFATGVISYEFDNIIFSKISNTDSNILMLTANYLIYTIPLIIVLLLIMMMKKNKYMLKTFSLKKNKLLLGLGIGFLLNSLCVTIAYLHGDIKLVFNNFNILIFIFVFIAVTIQCSAEEILCRVFIYEKLRKSYKSYWVAIIINSLFFSLTHIYNDGITLLALISIFEMGIVTSLMVCRYNNIWGAIGIHTAWNFTQNIIYGLPNSGIPATYSVFKLIESRNSFAYDTIFGVEATLVAIITVFLMSVLMYVYFIKKDNIILKY